MIRAENLCIQAGSFCLENITFSIARGTYCVLMGRTGSGKTTLLETVCGLKRLRSGLLFLDGQDTRQLPPNGRGIGFVPQDGALFYTMTVRAHLEFALRIRKWSSARRRVRVDELAEMLEIRPLLDRRPFGLSGGEAQRVALGRALAFKPRILCLDEPLSSLDDDTRLHLIGMLKRIQAETGVTALHVTHHEVEADQLADTRLTIHDGQVEVA